LQIMATFKLGRAYWDLGDYRRAIECLRRSAEALSGERRRERFGEVYLPSVFSRVWLALCLAKVGAFVEGMAIGAEGVQIAEAVDHPLSCIGAYWGVGSVSLDQGDLHQAIPFLEHALGLSQVVHAPVWSFLVAATLSIAYALSRRGTEALGLLKQAVTWVALPPQSHYALRFSEVYVLTCHLEEASGHARESLASARTYKERGDEAYALRLLGDIAAHREPPQVEQAAAHYRQALALADELGMRPLQAHCHRGLGTLYAATGQREQARIALSTAIEMYRTMDMTFWLPQAEAVLAQVEGR
jgi:tetratricopeptide (TPR) repeat protein